MVIGKRLAVWNSPDAPENWRGAGRFRYSDKVIDAILMLRAVFQLPFRQATGLVRSLLRLLEIDLPTPDISTLSSRGKLPGLYVAPARGPTQAPHHRRHKHGGNRLRPADLTGCS